MNPSASKSSPTSARDEGPGKPVVDHAHKALEERSALAFSHFFPLALAGGDEIISF
jgi:hypothetical protein